MLYIALYYILLHTLYCNMLCIILSILLQFILCLTLYCIMLCYLYNIVYKITHYIFI